MAKVLKPYLILLLAVVVAILGALFAVDGSAGQKFLFVVSFLLGIVWVIDYLLFHE